jgi:hypothetical protein
MNKLSIAELSYIAGIIDGEGCISITKLAPQRGCVASDYKDRVHVANTDYKLIKWLLNKTGLGNVREIKSKNPKHKTRYDWILHRGKTREFLIKILPFLVIKKGQAIEMLKFRSTFCGRTAKKKSQAILTRRENCYQKLRKRV